MNGLLFSPRKIYKEKIIYKLTIVIYSSIKKGAKYLQNKISTIIKIIIIINLVIGFSTPAFQVLATDKPLQENSEEVGSWIINVDITNLENSIYDGTLKVYVVEPVSRWNNYDGDPYNYAFLDYAYDEEISIADSQGFDIAWNPSVIGDIQHDNLMVIATVFNDAPHQKYSYGENYPFNAYYADATAAAMPNQKGYNEVTEDFSHTVFAEEGTATWCPYCPNAAEALTDIYESNDYPFYFVALVGDKSDEAMSRLGNDYNMGGFPTTFFDGGNYLHVGASSGIEQQYRSYILSCGQREVPRLNMSVSLEWDPDETPPTVQITQPKNGLYVMNEKKRDMEKTIVVGTMDVMVDVEDEESEIVKVEYYVDGRLRSEERYSPYKFSNWKENGLFGIYQLKVIAYDEAGNQNVDEVQVLRFF